VHSNFFTLLIIIFAYYVSLSMVGITLGSIFDKPRLAPLFTWLVIFICMALYLVFRFFVFNTPGNLGAELAISLFSPVAFAEIMYMTGELEARKIGLSFNNWVQPLDPGLDFTAAYGFGFLCLDILLYGFIAFYVTQVLSEGCRSEKFNFLFTTDYWKRFFGGNRRLQDFIDNESNNGVQIKNLKKIYPATRTLFCKKKTDPVKAVDGLDLTISKGETFALLGHNGAGKSTTISIISGVLTPTSGDLTIFGMNASDYGDIIPQLMGLCPQDDVIWDKLTAREHLRIFGVIKGISEDKIEEEVTKILKEIDLENSADEFAVGFSGGMKRKLMVGIAFIGNPKLIVLDECTAGMDPYSRRKVWDLIQKNKRNKTIILTTHVMEEADLLGDHIAIMSKGKLRTLGTSLELKTNFGIGYHLHIALEEGAIVDAITEFIKNYIQGALFLNNNSVELTYQLPQSETHKYAEFFTALDKSKNALKIDSYGIAMTTLEEVFLKIAHEDENVNLVDLARNTQVTLLKQKIAQKSDILL